MYETQRRTHPRTDLEAPVRNHYFYSKMMDAYHFELETDYGNRQRYRHNRLVSGIGVVCGMDVTPGKNADEIIITAGLAIDRWGREIVVPHHTEPKPIPADILTRAVEHAAQRKEDPCITVHICYHECLSDPAPVLAGDCNNPDQCVPGVIREQYRVTFEVGCLPSRHPECRVPDVLNRGELDYAALARWVTRTRTGHDLSRDPCIPLANITLSQGYKGHGCRDEDIDIAVRPIVLSNVALFELYLALLGQEEGERRDEDGDQD